MAFDGTEGAMISEGDARQFMNNYKSGPCITWNQGVKGHFFGKDILEDLLSQQGAKGIRIYYSSKPTLNGNLEPQLILVAVDSNQDDILNANKIADASRPCPIFCPQNTGLTLP